MCNCASSMTKRCGCRMPSRVLSIVLLSMLTQRGAPGARKFLSHTQKSGGQRHISVYFQRCVCFYCLLINFFHFLYNLGTFSMSHIFTGLPETQILRLQRCREKGKIINYALTWRASVISLWMNKQLPLNHSFLLICSFILLHKQKLEILNYN